MISQKMPAGFFLFSQNIIFSCPNKEGSVPDYVTLPAIPPLIAALPACKTHLVETRYTTRCKPSCFGTE